jgi:hypothetical protein
MCGVGVWKGGWEDLRRSRAPVLRGREFLGRSLFMRRGNECGLCGLGLKGGRGV